MSARRPWAWPLVPLYGAALSAQHLLRLSRIARPRRLHWPVLSVGSVSAGGAGKTPATIALATLLRERGWVVDVLSRGYGRAGRDVERVDPTLPGAALRFGDEPVLIAERAAVPVWVGASRYAAGRAAEGRARRSSEEPSTPWLRDEEPDAIPFCAHILDDGLQHRALARHFDLVLLTLADLNDHLLPAGNLREPMFTALRRADALVVRENELEAVSERLHKLGGVDPPLWTVRRALHLPPPLGVFGAGLRPLAFCGLARPEDFAASLIAAGCGVVDTVIFPDHHRYEERDLPTLVRVARQLKASGLVTTEKDAVKISPAMRSRLEGEVGPLIVARLQTSFVYEAPVVRALEKKIRPPSEAGMPPETRSR